MGPDSLPTRGECRTHVDIRGRKSLTEVTRTCFRKGEVRRIFGWTRPSPRPLATRASFNSTPYASTPILKGNRFPLSVPRRSSRAPHPGGLTIQGCTDRSFRVQVFLKDNFFGAMTRMGSVLMTSPSVVAAGRRDAAEQHSTRFQHSECAV
jgi:hypothetical protein